MNTPVTKKTIVKRQYGLARLLITVPSVLAMAYMTATMEDMLEVDGIWLLLILIFWIDTGRKNKKVKQNIQRQEQCLGVEFDRDMQGIYMDGIFTDDVEMVAGGDWCMILSLGSTVAINRRYISGIKSVRSITTGAKYTDNPPVQIVFRTIEETEMTCVIKSGREPAKDLCDWILQS